MTENTQQEFPAAANQTNLGIFFMLLGFAVYSLHDVLIKSLAAYSVFQTIFFAMLFSYLPFSIARIIDGGAVSLRPKDIKIVLARSFLMLGSLTCAMTAFSMLPMVQVYVLLFTTPIFISLLAIPILGEHVGIYRSSMILMGLIGVIIVLRPSPTSIQIGHLFGLLAAFFGAFAAILARKIGHRESAATLIMFPLIINIFFSGAMLVFVYQPMPFDALIRTFLIGSLALVGQLCILNGYRKAPATLAAPMQYSQLIWALIYGSLFFGEDIDSMTLLGAFITILSGILIVWRESKVSVQRPVTNTRNLRMVNSSPVPSSQYDSVDPSEEPEKPGESE